MQAWAHPFPDDLGAYAAGALSDGMSLLVASHLTFCPACRDTVARFEALGGALLAEAPGMEVTPPSLEAALAGLHRPEPEADAPAPPTGEMAALPLPLRRRLGSCGAIRWRPLTPGLAEFRLGGTRGEQVGLFRARPGVTIHAHGHDGEEATLVLRGRMLDGGREFGPGDVARAGPGATHAPKIVGDEICICLAVICGRRRFTGPLGSILNLLAR